MYHTSTFISSKITWLHNYMILTIAFLKYFRLRASQPSHYPAEYGGAEEGDRTNYFNLLLLSKITKGQMEYDCI